MLGVWIDRVTGAGYDGFPSGHYTNGDAALP
jgi:hypothetical protein